MATDVMLHLRNGVAVPVRFENDEEWELKDTERLVLVLGPNRLVRAAVNLADFIHATVEIGGDGG